MSIKSIIDVNKFACENIKGLESAVSSCEIKNEKDKANFGNLCVALRGFRIVADATEALLINENVLKGEDGNFYQKVEDIDACVSDFSDCNKIKEKTEK